MAPRFPDLVKKLVWRERYETEDPPERIFVKGAVTEQVGVGGASNSKDNRDVRSIDVGYAIKPIQLADIDSKRYKFVFDGIELAIKQLKLKPENVTVELITLPSYTHPVISLPCLIDEHAEIDPISFCNIGRGERLRRGCFAKIYENTKTHHKFFIVERQHFKDVLRAIKITMFELPYAMGVLSSKSIKQSKTLPWAKNKRIASKTGYERFIGGISNLIGRLKGIF